MKSYASIYIPRMSTIHTEDSIKTIMFQFSIGTVERVDFISINKKPGFSENIDDNVMSAFVHFSDPILNGDGCYSNSKHVSGVCIDLWNCMCFNQPYTLQITPNEWWVCLKNKNPVKRTMMNIHQVVENGRYLEKLVEEQRIMLQRQQKEIAELTKIIKGCHDVYQHRYFTMNNTSTANTKGRDRGDSKSAEPKGMTRAKVWTPEVENAYRFQEAGYKSMEEYLEDHDEPEKWPQTGFVKCLQKKTSGDYLYFRGIRECEDNLANTILDEEDHLLANDDDSISSADRIRNTCELCGNN